MADELRKAMEAAYDKAEAAAREEEQTDWVEETEASGEAVPEEKPEVEETPETEQTPEAPAEPEEAPPQKIAAKGKAESKAEKPAEDKPNTPPGGWGPKARESWAKLPPEVRAEVAKREREIAVGMQQSAQARQAMTQLNQVLEPYRQGLMQAGVNDPFQAIGTLFKTESQLRYGNVQEKAHTVANLIKNYGVDIATLDSILVGEAPRGNPQSEIERLLDQRLAPVNQLLHQQQLAEQQAAYEQQQRATQTVGEFSQNAEFINEVRNEMADLLDLAASRGRPMSLQEAYDIACSVHPEVKDILSRRQKEQQLMGNRQQMERKRAAASSLVGRRGGDGAGAPAQDIRSAIEDAWNSQVG